MRFRHYIIRLNRYLKTYGIFKTTRHLFAYLKSDIIQNKYIIFFSELTEAADELDRLPENITIEPRKSINELSSAELERLSSYWIAEIIKDNLTERYKRDNATLWLLKYNNEIAAFIWTTTKLLESDRFFPYGQRDIYLFDAGTFPEYRGRHYQPVLMKHIQKKLKEAGFTRCFIYVRELNGAMLRSISRSGWKKFGTARKFHLCGYDVVIWSDMANAK